MNAQIENLQQLVNKIENDAKILDCSITNLLPPGENYAGIMFKVDLTLTCRGKFKEINAIAKTPNFNVNEFFRNHIATHYHKEIGFYEKSVPCLRKFYKEQCGEDMRNIFPKLYAGRYNLDGTDNPVDENACILMEDLTIHGFQNIDRNIGFDLNGAKIILRDLALFHTVPICLRMKQPEDFEINIKQFAATTPKNPPFKNEEQLKAHESFRKAYMQLLLQCNEKIEPFIGKLLTKKRPGLNEDKEPFITIGHSDLWTNNTMQKLINNQILENKFIDFQQFSYQSQVKDLLLFLSTSLQTEVFHSNFNELIRFYHKEVVKILEKFCCYNDGFNWNNFDREIKEKASDMLGRIIFLMPPVHGKKGEPVIDTTKGPMFDMRKVTLEAKKRAVDVIMKFANNGWI